MGKEAPCMNLQYFGHIYFLKIKRGLFEKGQFTVTFFIKYTARIDDIASKLDYSQYLFFS